MLRKMWSHWNVHIFLKEMGNVKTSLEYDFIGFYKLNIHLHSYMYAAAAKSLQSCPTLCDPIDGSPPGSPIPGILQARTLEWVAISFTNA